MAKQDKYECDIEKVCAYCENASVLHDRDFMLCRRKGVVSAGHLCRHFSYDPLKRIPVPRKNISDDFELPSLPD